MTLVTANNVYCTLKFRQEASASSSLQQLSSIVIKASTIGYCPFADRLNIILLSFLYNSILTTTT